MYIVYYIYIPLQAMKIPHFHTHQHFMPFHIYIYIWLVYIKHIDPTSLDAATSAEGFKKLYSQSYDRRTHNNIIIPSSTRHIFHGPTVELRTYILYKYYNFELANSLSALQTKLLHENVWIDRNFS